jgi:hypothetical protein
LTQHEVTEKTIALFKKWLEIIKPQN